MQQDILINWSPQETRVAVVEHGVVQELHVERSVECGWVGNIYLGRVARVLPGMQSAFVDIGLERTAFLHVADLLRPELPDEGPAERDEAVEPIEKRIFQGQSLLVQVIKDPLGSKGARLSTQISLAGRMLVCLPQSSRIGVSRKIGSAERDTLRARMQALLQADGGQDLRGFILRTNAEGASDADLQRDVDYLRRTWAHVLQASRDAAAPALLHRGPVLLQRVLRDLVTEQTASVQIDSAEQFAALQAFAASYMPGAVAHLARYRGERPIFDLYGIDDEINRALGRQVDLKSGGYLVIDQTEALTTIDVNTGGFVGRRNFDETVFKTNLEAAQAIARQLRLRNLGGIVVVDFIGMTQAEHQDAVLAELRKRVAMDRVKTYVGEFSPLGLVEMTRKRTRESLAQALCSPCSQCRGTGRVRSTRSTAYEILREILREARQFDPREFRVLAAPEVVEMLMDEEGQYLAGLQDFIGKPISLRAETDVGPDQYDIVLL
ncbi:MAG: Rne/Rng family ribonuclease [Ottowia sp.]|nr:Rne/Rng family ribonuclease [Ottowia sp.]